MTVPDTARARARYRRAGDTADSLRSVVDADLAGAPADYIQQVAAEAAALLASDVTNGELAEWLGGYIVIEAEGYTERSFITMSGDRNKALG